MVTANYLWLRCHFHKESFGSPAPPHIPTHRLPTPTPTPHPHTHTPPTPTSHTPTPTHTHTFQVGAIGLLLGFELCHLNSENEFPHIYRSIALGYIHRVQFIVRTVSDGVLAPPCVLILSGAVFVNKMPSCGHRDPHYKHETIVRAFWVYNGNSYTPQARLLT